MSTTEQLIHDLVADMRPHRRGAAQLRLALGVAGGMLLSLTALTLWLRPPLAALAYTGVPAFAMKLAFAASMVAISSILLFASGRPGQAIGARFLWLLAPPALVLATAIMELAITAPRFREDAWFGSTWQTCLVAIIGLSLPVLLGIGWAFRRMAPTNLRLAGLLAGLASGSAAAAVYALFCPETTATFLASWYSLGILSAGLIGWLCGPRLLRW